MPNLELPPVPRRAFSLALRIGADSRDDLIAHLRVITEQLANGQDDISLSDGACSLSVDETITRAIWDAASRRYAEWLASPERISDSF